MSYGLQSYKTSKATTASKEDLLIMLYEGAIRFLELSISEKEAGRLGEHKLYLRKGLAIVSELQNTLDFRKGGEIAISLFELYGFMLEYLTKANITQDLSYIREVVRQLSTLLDGWRDAIRQVKSGAAATTSAPLPRTISRSL
ncbi:MAG: flagellar export chaperone FliS [Magnetococcales bacterium]|nr:flagellar export chaperone FliS [Magnetococcales bacterium]